MIDAIYQGLLYGIIAGFAVGGFALTLAMLYGFIEGVTFLLGMHEKYFTSGGSSNEHGGNGA